MSVRIDCRQLTCRYPAGAPALDGVSFSAEAGSWTWLIGPSGSGKTTLLRALAGLEPAAGGEIAIGGQPMSAGSLDTAPSGSGPLPLRAPRSALLHVPPHARGVGLLFQEPSLWPHLSVRANVELGVTGGARARVTAPPSRRARQAEALGWLERLGLTAFAVKFPGELSGGEQRRVALARTLAARPCLLLLDEPTAHLDLHLREGLMLTLLDLHRELGLTTLCVTHQVEPPMAPADRLLVLEAGRLPHDGPLAALAQAPSTPWLTALRRSLVRSPLVSADPNV